MISLSRVFEPSNWKTSSAFRAHNTISLGKSWVNSVAKQEWKTGRSMNQEHNWIYQLSKALLLQFQPLFIKKLFNVRGRNQKNKVLWTGVSCVHETDTPGTWSLWNLFALGHSWTIGNLQAILQLKNISTRVLTIFPTPPKQKKNNNSQESNHNRLKSPKFSPTATQLKSLPHLQKLDRLPKSFQKNWRFCLGDLIPKRCWSKPSPLDSLCLNNYSNYDWDSQMMTHPGLPGSELSTHPGTPEVRSARVAATKPSGLLSYLESARRRSKKLGQSADVKLALEIWLQRFWNKMRRSWWGVAGFTTARGCTQLGKAIFRKRLSLEISLL